MKPSNLSTLIHAACLTASLVPAAWAQPPRMKMTTDIPPEIIMPNRVETRLGTLKFFDGFPDQKTIDKLNDNLDFVRGVQAYLSSIPGADHARASG